MADPEHQSSTQAKSVLWAVTPVLVIQSAIDVFTFNCFVHDAISHARISPGTFRDQVTVDVGGHGLTLKRTFTPVQVAAFGRNNVVMAFGTTAIATDKAMHVLFGDYNPDDTTDLGSARAIVYQIRCAFAHDPLNPVWTPKPARYKHTYRLNVQVPRASGEITSRPIELHPPTLAGKPFNPGDVGGLGGYFGLLQYCLRQVQAHSRGNLEYVPSEES